MERVAELPDKPIINIYQGVLKCMENGALLTSRGFLLKHYLKSGAFVLEWQEFEGVNPEDEMLIEAEISIIDQFKAKYNI